MSNIYEALQLAEKENSVVGPEGLPAEHAVAGTTEVTTSRPANQEKPTRFRTARPLADMDRELLMLYQNIDFCLPETNQRAVQFIAAHEGEGVSTLVREFARVMGVQLKKSVLIVDAAHRNPSQHIHFNIDQEFGWREAMDSGEPLEKAVYKAAVGNVYLSPLVPHSSLPPQVYNDVATTHLLTELKQKFDLILIDSSPATVSPDSLAISRNVDGVVLVVEAERTRWPVVEKVKESILNNGGNILGLVLNKRRYHIPESIYRRL